MYHSKITYRPEIDGLRAIAVFTVILYHANIYIFGKEIFSGGYLGVDVFFVISGYLITSLIFKELEETKNFSFINFYKRRVRRILPVLFFIASISLIVSYFTLLPNSLIDFVKSVISSIGFVSNFYFYLSGGEYSAIESLLNPFLHTWSLSIEEQYYLVFPLLLFIFYKKLNNKIIICLILLFLISFLLAIFYSETNKSLSFYSFQTRFWELIAGSIISVVRYKKIYKLNNRTILNYIIYTSFFVLISSFFLFNDKSNHPSLITLLPVLSVCLIILFSNNNQIIIKILSSKFFVFFGLISYSLYLWHYPIFSFYRVYFAGGGFISYFLDKILIVVLLFSLSIFSYFVVEKYFRNRVISFSKVIIFLSLNLFFIIYFFINSINSNGYENRIPAYLKNKLNIVNFYTEEYRNCFVKFNFKTNDYCKYGNFEKNLVLVGDSRSAFLINDLKNKILKKKYNFNILTFGKLKFNNLNEADKFLLGKVSEFKNSIIILNGVYNDPSNIFRFSEQEDNFLEYFRELDEDNNKIIFLSPIPIIDNPYNFSEGNMKLVNMIKNNKVSEFKIKRSIHENNLKEFRNFEEYIKNKTKNVYFLDLDNIFCDHAFCYSIKDGFILLQDKYHQSGYTAKMINDEIINKINSLNKINK